jgi:Fe-S cluster biosynthesis and repair protein YggX
MTASVTCSRCAQQKPQLPRPPVPGAVGREIHEHVCADCWAEWQSMEVMVINELRLNFMDPSAQEILAAETRKFLGLDGAPGAEPEKNPDPR